MAVRVRGDLLSTKHVTGAPQILTNEAALTNTSDDPPTGIPTPLRVEGLEAHALAEDTWWVLNADLATWAAKVSQTVPICADALVPTPPVGTGNLFIGTEHDNLLCYMDSDRAVHVIVATITSVTERRASVVADGYEALYFADVGLTPALPQIGNPVTGWADQSGNERDLTMVVDHEPLFGIDSRNNWHLECVFTTQRYMAIAGMPTASTSHTLRWTATYDTIPPASRQVIWGMSNSFWVSLYSDGNLTIYEDGGEKTLVACPTGKHDFELRLAAGTPGTATLYIDGVAQTPAAYTGTAIESTLYYGRIPTTGFELDADTNGIGYKASVSATADTEMQHWRDLSELVWRKDETPMGPGYWTPGAQPIILVGDSNVAGGYLPSSRWSPELQAEQDVGFAYWMYCHVSGTVEQDGFDSLQPFTGASALRGGWWLDLGAGLLSAGITPVAIAANPWGATTLDFCNPAVNPTGYATMLEWIRGRLALLPSYQQPIVVVYYGTNGHGTEYIDVGLGHFLSQLRIDLGFPTMGAVVVRIPNSMGEAWSDYRTRVNSYVASDSYSKVAYHETMTYINNGTLEEGFAEPQGVAHFDRLGGAALAVGPDVEGTTRSILACIQEFLA